MIASEKLEVIAELVLLLRPFKLVTDRLQTSHRSTAMDKSSVAKIFSTMTVEQLVVPKC